MRRIYEAPALTLSANVVKATNANSSGPDEGGLKPVEAGSVGFYL
jgi:hypothetical protein